MRLKFELERKQKEIQNKMANQKKEQEAKDMERRRRIMERIKRMKELEREQEALKKLSLQRLKEKMERKQKMKRTGGGFSVPYDLTKDEVKDIKKSTIIQNWMSDSEEAKDVDSLCYSE